MTTSEAGRRAVGCSPFLRWWSRVDRSSARSDLTAGVTGALIVLPQGVAFATIAGLPPEYGLYAAMVPAVVAALFGSSWHLVTGPTTAISIAVFATVAPLAEPGSAEYVRLVLTLTFLTGVFQLAMGLARLGALVNFISHTVVIGFTAGAALLIAASQIEQLPRPRLERGLVVPRGGLPGRARLGDVNPYVVSVGACHAALGVVLRRLLPRLHMILALVVGSLIALASTASQGAARHRHHHRGRALGRLPPITLPDFSLGRIAQGWCSPALASRCSG